jgi:hypothetical protein
LLSSREAIEQDKHKSRAQRFPIEAPLRYRAGGEFAWTEGATVNISRSGILFRAEKEIPPRTMLQMRIMFPSELTGYGRASILCWGPVVRNESVSASGCGTTLAAAIIKYRFIQDESLGLPVNHEL